MPNLPATSCRPHVTGSLPLWTRRGAWNALAVSREPRPFGTFLPPKPGELAEWLDNHTGRTFLRMARPVRSVVPGDHEAPSRLAR